MTALRFEVLSATPAARSASPAIVFRVRITGGGSEGTAAIALRCQIQIDARLRQYDPDEQQRLYELFGTPAQWDRTLRSLVWTQASAMVPAFGGDTEIDLVAPCSYDLHVAAANYLHGVRGRDVPLSFLFSGTMFTSQPGSAALWIRPVSWDSEATFRMPEGVWDAAVDRFFPGRGWIVLSRDTIDALQAFKGQQALPTWDDAVTALLRAVHTEEPA